MSELTNIAALEYLMEYDPAVGNAMNSELKRQRRNLELIASENIVTPAVMAAMGSHLTNKYAEGYPGKRYYGGCECVDVVEEIARQRACELFGAEHANVQPHSGAQANTAVYFAMLEPGDTVMGMNLNEGGHLTHGSPVNISGKYFNFVAYGVDPETHYIDYDKVLETAKECKPKLIVAGASAYPRVIDFKRLREDNATVVRLEYDPNRSANIALIQYEDGSKAYILAPVGLKPGHIIETGADADIKPGNCLPLSAIPVGTIIHNIELHPGKGAQLVRAAGEQAQLMAKEGDSAQIRLPSGEYRLVKAIHIGKAGRKRHMGWRPTVRGSVMNPNDHPHGGGEGRAPIGHAGPMTPWGKPALGYKTRKKKNPTDKFIVRRRDGK